MPNKTYADILGEKSNIDIPLTDYIKQEVSLKDDPNNQGSIATEYQLYLQSKKLKKPKPQNTENHKLEWRKVGTLHYSPKVMQGGEQKRLQIEEKYII